MKTYYKLRASEELEGVSRIVQERRPETLYGGQGNASKGIESEQVSVDLVLNREYVCHLTRNATKKLDICFVSFGEERETDRVIGNLIGIVRIELVIERHQSATRVGQKLEMRDQNRHR
jgi:hypothetical protein